MLERYIYAVSREPGEELLETLLEEGVTLEWWEPMFNLIGGSVPSDEVDEIHSSIRDIEWIRAIEKERYSSAEDETLEKTERAVAEPKFDSQGIGLDQAQKLVEKEASNTSEFTPAIAVIDSGIDSRNDQIGAVRKRINFTDEEELDALGHGTLTTIALEYSTPFEKDLIDMKVATKSGTKEGAVIRALRSCVQHEVEVANLSLGFQDHDKREVCPICTAAEIATSNGVLVIAAAGNHGRVGDALPAPECPARSESTLSVGALRSDDTPRYESGAGDVFAPSSWDIYEPRE